ncbi:DUF4256 domain-containing protein [Anaerorhabdus furcosa]|uniref:DUF4256 domain-containing protein n=1 Tax=Anaerorhabdus furcosa TaxID=118967 RepID=A0A1T4LKY5_9FIRM|nr:DUF4256 domain-containing protein [Anaerorhabdus furcosa]SJZ55168.1 Protein of unknown function [Anaerorhabdus furcosa]
MPSKKLTKSQKEELLFILEERFNHNMKYHETLKWKDILIKLQENPSKLESLFMMNETGGEPDVIGFDSKTKEYLYVDCSKESPKGRYNLCYDREALNARKKFKPENSAVDLANEMGIELLDEEQYKSLQSLAPFDTKTSSWIKTPNSIRKLGGALFCDRRFDTVFVYHNGAESYYGGRGFRGILKI